MAYTHSKYEVEMNYDQRGSASVGGVAGPTHAGAVGGPLSVTTVMAAWGPGVVPHIIRGAAVVMTGTNVGAFTGGPVGCRFEADISTPGTATHLFTISLPSSGAANKAIFHIPTYHIEIPPGSEVQMHPTTAATAGVRARVMLYVEPRWEQPGNVTTMRAAT